MITVVRRMDCAPAAVLDVLADGWSYVAWVVGASRIRSVSPDWPAEGARIEHSVGLWPALLDDVTDVKAWDPENGIDLVARGWPAGEAAVSIRVKARPDGCVVRIDEDVVAGPGTLVPRPLRAAVLRARNTETLRRLSYLAERRTSSD
ncbi:SRPBCC family protein [Cellulomonas palmilytica]|nr:SRPBCC family protein [Cellulomonas palmilytica]